MAPGTEQRPKVGFYGLGIMGGRMAANVAEAGFELCVATHTPGKAEAWAAAHGTAFADTAAELAAQVDVLISMVVDGEQVEGVLFGDAGVVHGARPGLLCIDMSTISPRETVRYSTQLAQHDITLIDAPVTGSSPRAETATLTIMCGGPVDHVERARPVLDTMGSLVVHVGEVGAGEMLKLVNNSVAAANAVALAEALVVGHATGVDLDALVQVMASGSGNSAMLELKAGPMRAHDYTPLFKLDHMLKDVRLTLEEAQEAGVPFPTASHARGILSAARERGFGEQDFAALLEGVEALAGQRL